MEKYDFYFKKNFGQNFLIDGHVLNKIINGADIQEDELVIEIGPGVGGLTEAMAKRAGKVIAIEIDKSLIPILNEILSPYENVEIINADALKTDFKSIIENSGYKKAKLIANLPYYATTPIIMNMLEQRLPISSMTVMIQKEVAERMAAKPSTKSYGSLTLAVEYYSEVYLVANVPRNCFMPRPNVDSAVIRLDILNKPPVNVKNEELMFKIIKAAFGQRRKTLVNCLYNLSGLNFTKEEYADILKKINIQSDIRGENLSLTQFSELANALSEAEA
ncbi:16S rRNA (adenine(1518)-N(6)/adenine(1519)-N(6))-dimethyltransferase RsmA [Anaeropeptidivorans aminofermentans]|uniref:16S rRNA (adenine(1518)-N(6)/adenine(1519)-N(6))- dimethyltransferase RsmA n=1 Tax=Anaeropeptidivorans aminofermentans TaxID=2934315 RepID=UPI002B1FED4D|nr:16S rRNA (adenine(1518)-N(6)/adenine(1519)-N(6))-dimethyltransferase RsmA [Anaeropeptidivorans aminofermentans]